ncbi:MAG: hypothetical protein H7Y60_07990 [Rhodospirillaceae bacterium]|nr:hypothetical protein [Rhodospirillales bacterium]
MNDIDLATVTYADFEAHLNKAFAVEYQEGNWSFTLSHGRQREGNAPPNAKRQPFSVFFAGPPGLNLGQGNMLFSNPDFGRMTAFAVPVGLVDAALGDNSPIYYQLCFN